MAPEPYEYEGRDLWVPKRDWERLQNDPTMTDLIELRDVDGLAAFLKADEPARKMMTAVMAYLMEPTVRVPPHEQWRVDIMRSALTRATGGDLARG